MCLFFKKTFIWSFVHLKFCPQNFRSSVHQSRLSVHAPQPPLCKNKKGWFLKSSFFSNRQRPTFPGSFPPSIIGARELNCCVRDGNRCILSAIVTGFSSLNWMSTKLEYDHWLSVRPISIGQLNALLHLHLRPINVIVSHESYLKGGNLFLWGASHLDAFSAYPVRR